jgi:hypothetical protein
VGEKIPIPEFTVQIKIIVFTVFVLSVSYLIRTESENPVSNVSKENASERVKKGRVAK